MNGSSTSSNDAAAGGFPGVDRVITVNPGNRIPLIPRYILKFFADYRFTPAWSASADVTAIGGAYALGNENNQHRPDGIYYLGPGRSVGYPVFNLGIDYKPTPTWSFFVHVGNLFDRKYATAAQLGATALDANGRALTQPFPANTNGDRPLQNSSFFSPGASRSVLLGVRYAFGG